MAEASPSIEIRATFLEPAHADAAVNALPKAGIPISSIDLQHGILPEVRQREGPFLTRVLVIIILWSIVGALPGAAFGFLSLRPLARKGAPASSCRSPAGRSSATSSAACLRATLSSLTARNARCRPTARSPC